MKQKSISAKLTPQEIDRLIDWRNRITTRRYYGNRLDELDRIDHKLAQVPSGTDNRVDLALGRPCATLPARPDYHVTAAQAEQYRAMSEGQPDGVVEHDDALAGAW